MLSANRRRGWKVEGEERRSHRREKTKRGGREREGGGEGAEEGRGHEVTGVTQSEAARARR